ncbi:DUF1570 domain-containing protein [Tautonia plasticadhaerens]|uniref:DUF1570 domain-containing protein n=1 Tax=Tautonia plasticadhaerens TaxID=2527974 RepID=A0A518H960_9BACT|nr:DUF1570 domain-containing protein [Tautonia plasticadhaerens]QDV37379.1 hypothetical protein ElP_53170 [Tautonia plasticadhaerens]
MSCEKDLILVPDAHRPDPRQPEESPWPTGTGMGTSTAAEPPRTDTMPEDPCPFDPRALRRSARLRGLREAGLLSTLTAVMGITAFHAWHDTIAPGLIDGPPQMAERVDRRDGPSLRVRNIPDRRRPRQLESAGDRPVLHRARPRPEPIEEQQQVPPPVVEEASGAGLAAPTVQAPPVPPHQPIRAIEPATIPDVQGLDALPHLPVPLEYQPSPAPAPVAGNGSPIVPIGPAGGPDAPRLLVGDDAGRVLVSRLYARAPSGPVVILPDGSLGWPEGEVPTDRPFRPWTPRQLGHALRSGRFQGFRAIEREPYLVLTQGSESFARDAAELLQGLFHDLIECLDDGGLPVVEPEFPLVAIIFRDEDAFREYRPVDRDVRAYYEITTNRIILYEHSAQDLRAPELTALRRPQTIAHEGVHQILQNVGVQPRLASWPAWLVEGLAEYYAPTALPDDQPHGSPCRGDYGRRNFGRVNPFHMATLIDLQDPAALLTHLRGPGPGLASPSWTQLGPEKPWVAHLMLRTDLSPTDYALAWSLTHYLAHNHPDEFRSYLLALAQFPPLEPRTSEQHFKGFTTAFGQSARSLARRVDRHLASLRYERVPFYAVRFEQPTAQGYIRRGVLVSPSPTMISQWLEAQALPEGLPLTWWASPFDSRNRARLACESWLFSPHP